MSYEFFTRKPVAGVDHDSHVGPRLAQRGDGDPQHALAAAALGRVGVQEGDDFSFA